MNSLLSTGEAITVDCAIPMNGNAGAWVQVSKHAPTMNEPTFENVLAPHALLALTRQKYCVAMSRSIGTVKVGSPTCVSITMLLNAASRAIWRWYAEAPNANGVTCESTGAEPAARRG